MNGRTRSITVQDVYSLYVRLAVILSYISIENNNILEQNKMFQNKIKEHFIYFILEHSILFILFGLFLFYSGTLFCHHDSDLFNTFACYKGTLVGPSQSTTTASAYVVFESVAHA
jgi:hypothetical protein